MVLDYGSAEYDVEQVKEFLKQNLESNEFGIQNKMYSDGTIHLLVSIEVSKPKVLAKILENKLIIQIEERFRYNDEEEYKLTQYEIDCITNKLNNIIDGIDELNKKFSDFGKSIIKFQSTLEKLNNSLEVLKNE